MTALVYQALALAGAFIFQDGGTYIIEIREEIVTVASFAVGLVVAVVVILSVVTLALWALSKAGAGVDEEYEEHQMDMAKRRAARRGTFYR